MDDGDRQQINQLASSVTDRCVRNFAQQLQVLNDLRAAKGASRSRATMQAAIQQMEAGVREAMATLLRDVSAVDHSDTAFAIIENAIHALLQTFGAQIPSVQSSAGFEPFSVGSSDALRYYRGMKTEIEAELLIIRSDFQSGALRTSKPSPSVVKSKGGAPLASHWDAMWAEVAVQLWTGDLKPESQADIKRAMFAWFNVQGIDVSDTIVTGRARQLWTRMNAEE